MKKTNRLLSPAVLVSLGFFLSFVATSAFSSDALTSSAVPAASATTVQMTVYKSPTCGCCQKWVEHIEQNEFSSVVVEMEDLNSIKSRYAIAGQYRSCHTGVVTVLEQDYIFEGHVPAEYVSQFLSNPPTGALGLSVPGMPAGSPGMEVGNRKDHYQVLLLNTDGSSSVYAEVN